MFGQATRSFQTRPRLTLSLQEDSLRQLTVLLVAAAVAETFLLRLATRVAVHVPRGEAVSEAMHGASFLGTLALNLASVLAIGLVVVVLALVVWRVDKGPARLLLGGLSAAMLWGLGSTLMTNSVAGDALFGLTITMLVAAIGLGSALRRGVSLEARTAIGLMVLAYVCYQYYALGHLFARALGYTAVPPLTVAMLRAGEALVVVAGGAVFWAWGARGWRHAGVAGTSFSALAVLFIGASSLAPASTTSILALWTTGLSLFLPLPLYLIALGLYLLTALACVRSDEAFWTGAGLLLILLAGYMPEATYDHLLLLLGVAFVAGAVRPAPFGAQLEVPEDRPA